MDFNEFISRLEVSKRLSDGSFMCHCPNPAHEDKTASFHVTKGDKGILIHCFKCKEEDVLGAMGLRSEDLFYDSGKRENEKPPEKPGWQRFIEKYTGKRVAKRYDYAFTGSDRGKYAYTKLRLVDGQGKKDFLLGVIDGDRWEFGRPKGVAPAGYAPCGMDKLAEAAASGEDVFVTEGEKDAETLWKRGMPSFTAGSSSSWKSCFAELFAGATVFILRDNDAPGERMAKKEYSDIGAVAKKCHVINPALGLAGGDVTDYFKVLEHSSEDFQWLLDAARRGIAKDSVQADADTVKNVSEILDKDEGAKGKMTVRQTAKNHEAVLEHDARFSGKIRYNEFACREFLSGDVPWDKRDAGENGRSWGETDDSAAFSIIQSEYRLRSRNDFRDALKIVATRHSYHPVRDFLDEAEGEWDGQGGHIRTLAPKYLGSEDSEYVFQVVKLWMLEAVARIYEPGCKADSTLILRGKQGIGKSRFLRKMAMKDEWFMDSLSELDSAKAAQLLLGSWIIELAELNALAKTWGGEQGIKAFLTIQQDKMRLPYARRDEIYPRQCVFAGTTNQREFLLDTTGNRRFLIIDCGDGSKDGLFGDEIDGDIRQAWGEAVHIHKTERPKLDLPEDMKKIAEEMRNDAMADTGLQGMIEAYISENKRKKGDKINALEIWREVLNEPKGTVPRKISNEIFSVMDRLGGWERRNGVHNDPYGRGKGYVRLKDEEEDFVEVTDQMELPFD